MRKNKWLMLGIAVILLLAGGMVFAQELEITGTIELDADLLSTKSTTVSDEKGYYGSTGTAATGYNALKLPPEDSWALIDKDSFDWENTKITFKVTADNYGGTFQIGAPTGGLPGKTTPAGTYNTAFPEGLTWIRNLEVWVKPLSFLKLSAANGDTNPWRAVERLNGNLDSSHSTAYGTKGFNLVSNIDEFKNGLKADIDILELAKVELLLGYNNPLWLSTGEVGKGALPSALPATVSYRISTGTAAGAISSDADIFANYLAANPGNTYVNSTFYDVDTDGVAYATLAAGHRVIFTKKNALDLETNAVKDITAYGRDAPNYGIRVTVPVEGIGKFYANYRLGIYSKTLVLNPNNLNPAKVEVEGYDVGVNNFGIFADLSPLFGGMDLPLGLVAGYTGYFVAGDKVADKDFTPAGTKTQPELIDATPIFVSGIDLHVSFKVNDALSLVLQNNATFFSLPYNSDSYGLTTYGAVLGGGINHSRKIGFDKYGALGVAGNPAAQTSAMAEAAAQEVDYTYFRLYNALGAKFQVTDTLALNLQLYNDLQTFGNYANSDVTGIDPKSKTGDPIYSDTFDVYLGAAIGIGENAELDIGLRLNTNTATQKSSTTRPDKTIPDPLAKTDGLKGKAETLTVTKFTIPCAIIVKF